MTETMPEVRLGELTFPVRIAGPEDGEPIIFLHGFPQTSAVWTSHLDRLSAAGFRAIAPDQRGYPATARPCGVNR